MDKICYSLCLRAGLARDLELRLHGQHLAQSVVLKAIEGFLKSPDPNKPLTLSFHGWSGTGKNFVARLIAENLYRDGLKSECVTLFIAPFHFPHARLVDVYKVGTPSCLQDLLISILVFPLTGIACYAV